jgi:alpha-L-arabinofuranosidase
MKIKTYQMKLISYINLCITSAVFCLSCLQAQEPAAHNVLPGRTDAKDVPASEVVLTIAADKPGVEISPTLYGIFFEEINRAGDGGLYAEMIQNRSFEDFTIPLGWSLVKAANAEAAMYLDKSHPLNANNRTCLRLEIKKADGFRVGVASEGFKGAPYNKANDKPEALLARFEKIGSETQNGIAVESGKQYNFSLYAQGSKGFVGPLTVALERQDGTVIASEVINKVSAKWEKFKGALIANATDTNARLVVSAAKPGTVWLDMISLFPKDTFKGRSNGLRADLAQMLVKMHPAFVRFPGGCFVEGDKLENAVRWKKTIGDIAERPGHWNLWGYNSTDGLGYHEYLQFSEDIGAEPLFVINCGMSHTEQHTHAAAGPEMDEFVQDALDAIEYANGPVESKWGALRAKAGHPKPFQLKFMEIGNENSSSAYNERYALIYDAIKKHYPKMQMIANSDPKSRPVEIMDEHYYRSPEYFAQHADQYDAYDRKGPKVYIGEYAVTRRPDAGTIKAALGEAAFMTGMERNGDIVAMSSYAPLFELVGWKRWSPNAIIFDSARAFGIPSYYAQAMFAANRGDVVLPVEFNAPTMPVEVAGKVGVGTWAEGKAEFKEIKVTQGEKTLFESDFTNGLQGLKCERGTATVKDGALVISGTTPNRDARVMLGDSSWKDYTLSLKARKISGKEGFLVLFAGGNNKSWVNLGGFGNTSHTVECDEVEAKRIPGQIETGRWYDVRLECKESGLKCYLDGNLILETRSKLLASLYAVAGRQKATNEIILKVVNMAQQPQSVALKLKGTGKLQPEAKALVMGSDDPLATNSFEQPQSIVPRESVVSGIASDFKHTFPAHSITILRMKEGGK